MESKTTLVRKPNLTDVLSESETILTANYTHFITLSLLFLPLSISLITPSPLFAADHFNVNSITFSYFFYILVVYLLSLCVVATICYSTHHGLSSKQQVNLTLPGLLETPWYRRWMLETYTAVKSLTSSFFPIVTTAVIAHSLLFLVVGTTYLIVATIGMSPERGPTFKWFSAVIIISIVTYFHVNWWLAFVVAVVESKSGISALRRSSCLLNGARWVSLLLFLYFVSFVWISVWVLSDGLRALSDSGYVLFGMMFGSIWMMSYLRHITIATTVLYNHCKAFHGELAIDGFDDKIRHVEA